MTRAEPTDYTPALLVAVEAAEAAAALIERERLRPGGPRGSDGHCPVDAEAEVAIRERLRAAFPNWQVFGEETGTTGAPSEHRWLVDPHDGTRAFQRGHRGTAVSIALLRGDLPVLGVVCAPAPPLGGPGARDLITWAEGAGPVRRNGIAVRRAWAGSLGPEHTVLVSQDADRAPELNASLVTPARYRAVASVAYRLALAAVGEGEVAVSVAGAQDYDYAAAHAILRGAGGVLLDATGAPVTYGREGGGRGSGGRAFGGAPGLTELVARRPWHEVHGAPRLADRALIAPDRARIAPAALPLDRAQGILLGQLIGDALGAQVEFTSAARIAAAFPEGVRHLEDGGVWGTLGGQPTDDSELALALARTLARTGRYDPSEVAAAYVAWFRSEPFDVGGTIGRALGAAPRDEPRPHAALRAAASRESQANGALMRVSPLAIFGFGRERREVLGWAQVDASLTHPHPICQAANVAYVAALLAGLDGASDPEVLWRAGCDAVERFEEEASAREAVLGRLVAARSAPPELDGGQMGWVLLALQNAFYELLHAPSAEEGLVATVDRGGDTDTNGAIAGALLGALHGARGFPHRWVDRILTCRPLPGSPTRHPRPMTYWPVDALQLAERLLISV